MRSKGIAYLLWACSFFGVCGLHRLYAGKIVTGLIWLFTGGLFFIGQFIDLFLIPSMVDEYNIKHKLLSNEGRQIIININTGTDSKTESKKFIQTEVKETRYDESPNIPLLGKVGKSFFASSSENLMKDLIELASRKNGRISVTDGVLATGRSFEEIEKTLNKMLKSGYVDIDNDPDSGIIIYKFREL